MRTHSGPTALLALALCAGCGADVPSAPEAPAPRGPYLGQRPPGSTAEVFAPGIVSTGLYERDLAITPDGREIYFCVALANYAMTAILVTRQADDGTWSEPEVAPFSGEYKDLEPAVSPDGNRLWFASHRPRAAGSAAQESADLWYMDRSGSGWGEPVRLGEPVNTDGPEFFPSVTRDGTLYFTRDFEGGKSFLYRTRPQGDGYGEPERLGPEVNSTQAQFNSYVAPDESYLIYGAYGREDSLGATDYYISFRDVEDRWTGPIHLGDAVNSASGLEFSPFVSPDGRYFFFMTSRRPPGRNEIRMPRTAADLAAFHAGPGNGQPDIWWIDAGFLAGLHPGAAG